MESISIYEANLEINFHNEKENKYFEFSYNGMSFDDLKNINLEECITILVLDNQLSSGYLDIRITYEKDGCYIDGDDYELYWDSDNIELTNEWKDENGYEQ